MANETVFRNGVVIKGGEQNGYVLTSDSNGLASWAVSLTGSGTAGYLPKFTGTYSIGNSGFVDYGDTAGYITSGGTISVGFTTNQVLFRDGSITVPGISFQNDIDTGFYRSGTNVITVAVGGVTSSKFTTKGIDLTDDGNLTVYGIKTASSATEAVRFSQLELTNLLLPKSGYVEGASFSGSPLIYSVIRYSIS